MELSIDTSTRFASVGLSRDGATIAELTWRSERNHSVEVAPAIRELLERADAKMADLEAVFVARGPGGFSALRVGMSTAKATAFALGKPLVAVGTLDVEAQPYLGLGVPVCALIDAGRDRVYAGRYEGDGPDATPDYHVLSHQQLAAAVERTTLFCGEGVDAVAELLKRRLGGKALIADVAPPTRRAGVLARLAFGRWRLGASDDPLTAQPIYLRTAQIDSARQRWATA